MMLFPSLVVPALAWLASVVRAQSALTVNTPSGLVFCQPSLLSWTGGTAPYFVKINEGGSVSATILTLLNGVTETQFTWTTNLPANTRITLAVKDSTGLEQYSGEATIGANPSGATTCNSATPNNTQSATGPAVSSTGSIPVQSNSAGASATSAQASASSAVASASATRASGAGYQTAASGGGALLLTGLIALLVHSAL